MQLSPNYRAGIAKNGPEVALAMTLALAWGSRRTVREDFVAVDDSAAALTVPDALVGYDRRTIHFYGHAIPAGWSCTGHSIVRGDSRCIR